MNKRSFLAALALACTVLTQSPVHSATLLGTAFTYQAQLKQAGQPVDGLTDFKFSLWTLAAAGSQVGGTITLLNVSVDHGLFTVTLDFGAASFIGDPRWLQIETRHPPGGGAYTLLAPRQAVTAVPYSLHTRGLYVAADGKVGVQDSSPAAALTVGDGDKFQVSGTDGDLTFTDDQASITFPAADATNAPMLHMFASGTGNGNRMVLAHSPTYPDWGLQYEDGPDKFHFLGSGTAAMTVDLANLRVGIGTTAPQAKLDVVGGEVRLPGGTAGGGSPTHFNWAGDGRNYIRGETLIADTGGNVGIGTGGPSHKLTIFSPDAETMRLIGPLGSYGHGGRLNFGDGDYAFIEEDVDDHLHIYASGGVAFGGPSVSVAVLEIRGADLAEKFPASEVLEPGMVAAIDPLQPGKLCVSRGAYNRLVAGVVSGANGLSVGAVLGNLPGLENAPAIALSGRVWVYCDATKYAIEPGDLLTTSDTPGHAMKATDYPRAQGAIIGKSMTGLNEGTGLALVLVQPQ